MVAIVSTYCFVASWKLLTGSCVTATEVNPPNVKDDAPSEIEVVPTVTALFVNAPLGIPLKFVPVRVGAVL